MTKLLVKNKPALKQTTPRISFLLFVFAALIITSCSKPAGTIGILIQPENSKLNLKYIDTTTIYAYSKPIDSVRSDEEYLSVNSLGSFKDPVFGTTNAGFYTQFFLSEAKQEFGTGRVLDSLVLQLDYSGIYGDTNSMLTIHTYEMLEGIDAKEAYYSNLQLSVNPTDYSNYSFVPRPNDSVVLGNGDTIPPVLRLNLSNYNPGLGEKLLAADTSDMEDSEIFRDYFQGLFLIAEPVNQGGCFAQFDLTTSLTGMTLYYHNNDKDSLSFDYLVTTAAARVSKYEHDFNTANDEFRQQVVEGDTALGKDKFYIQGFGGVKTIIQIPYINELRKLGKVAINEAKLVLNGSGEPYWGAPDQLVLYAINEDGLNVYLQDYGEGANYFGGFYKSSTNNYTFRITRYLQSIINDTTMKHYGFSLLVGTPWKVPERFIFNGQNGQESDSTSTIKLQILYTDLN